MTTITLHPDFRLGPVDRRVFGSFVEHLGRCVYTGIYEPDHPTADEHGFRRDVADLTQELGATVLRYPGGNFVSNYVWEDAVGPVEQRKPFLDLAWRTVEPNLVGTDEFLQYCEREGIAPMMAVNLGTRGIEAAIALLEYCNGEAGTKWADLRIANGREEPYGVALWCLGNEMDGPWQIGHKDAHEYGRLAAATGRAMRQVDPSIELVACGSSSMMMDTFGEWERTVLSYCYDVVDHISMHAYYEELDGDRASFLGSATAMATFIDRVAASADAIGAERRSDKQITISFDEWNVWYLVSRFVGETNLPIQRDAPRIIEDVYSALDAVVVGDMLSTLINHADRVAVGCLAQLVNVIAPIMTEPGGPAWRQTTFHPFATAARLARGDALQVKVDTGTLTTARHGDVPAVTAAATVDPETGALALFVTNRTDVEQTVTLRTPGATARLDGGSAVLADHVGPREGREAAEAYGMVDALPVAQEGDALTLRLAPESWTAFTGSLR
ncbi:arabinosylfuranosidase ArfA [Demequina lignilytica]|uniref:non-reducing end alpha-L-arabinofuranosidase n=1 Tax=Demequina lignilytica TaxID=3051663 RepID=A0AAW7M4Z5_9MICO|nr:MULTISPECIES: alpha-L-arabinofuranosidase C-terminal domain-containing protein [unclassified Demequina]MDN4479228.1 alpha-L-arabinofuranosidase C-terminal domain-containing protein [Demequina sp. SYSU T00039-1]MDN4484454.1 alpha-L-arabinofuranosidase C-terminal domain-containing protein [Demequina sp. SYSU T0a273]MDN4487913.1 alpha-L-arabinofuranosidase C-terminal domain-containing protein [Demequina sp. SYSU T00039]MDN4491719.1 alpha-L-arabinofuranosidase C-terminal domain-containing protei